MEVALLGCGRVGRELVSLLLERGGDVGERYGLEIRLRRVVTSRGTVELPRGRAYRTVLAELAESGPRAAAAGQEGRQQLEGRSQPEGRPGAGDRVAPQGPPPEAVLAGVEVLVDATPTDLATGGPGLTYLRAALAAGVHGVALSKGPLVADWAGLRELSARGRARLMVSGATAAALPAGDTLLYSLAGARVLAVEGVLNGTTNYILDRMGAGLTYAEALAEARARGIAEPDPRLDVEGWDTAAKTVILANLAWADPARGGPGGAAATLAGARVEGITGLTPGDLARCRRRGKVMRLLGRARPREGGDPEVEVGPAELEADHPLAGLRGADKGVTFTTDLMGTVTVTGGASSPRAAAAAALKDIIHLYARR